MLKGENIRKISPDALRDLDNNFATFRPSPPPLCLRCHSDPVTAQRSLDAPAPGLLPTTSTAGKGLSASHGVLPQVLREQDEVIKMIVAIEWELEAIVEIIDPEAAFDALGTRQRLTARKLRRA